MGIWEFTHLSLLFCVLEIFHNKISKIYNIKEYYKCQMCAITVFKLSVKTYRLQEGAYGLVTCLWGGAG